LILKVVDKRLVWTFQFWREILKQGFANLQIAAPNLKYSDLFRAAYREARTEKRGLHNE